MCVVAFKIDFSIELNRHPNAANISGSIQAEVFMVDSRLLLITVLNQFNGYKICLRILSFACNLISALTLKIWYLKSY